MLCCGTPIEAFLTPFKSRELNTRGVSYTMPSPGLEPVFLCSTGISQAKPRHPQLLQPALPRTKNRRTSLKGNAKVTWHLGVMLAEMEVRVSS